MKLVILKVNPDIINRTVHSVAIGIFDNDGRKTMEFVVPAYNLDRSVTYEEQQEVKLVPKSVVCLS